MHVRIVTLDKVDLHSHSEGGYIAWAMASTHSWQINQIGIFYHFYGMIVASLLPSL